MENIIDYWFYLLPLFLIFYIIKDPNFIHDLEALYEDYLKPLPKGMVVLESIPYKNKNSARYQALMWYLSNNNNETIYKSQEVFYRKYNYNTEKENNYNFFRVDQNKKFIIKDNIYGKVEIIEKEERTGDSTTTKEKQYRIKVFSKYKTVPELIEFLDNIVEKHKDNQLEKTLSKQLIIEAVFNKKEDYFDFNSYKWESNVSFENRFFENKDKIIKQINFFLNNSEYFEKKGIPYQLGILLHGVPGCGKTSFIKALAKMTKRHIIDIKLNNDINLSELKHLFLDENLDDDLIIPINKRLYIIEDIDVMGDIVHKRKNQDTNSEESDTDSEVSWLEQPVPIEGLPNKKNKKTKKKEKNTETSLIKLIGNAVSSTENKTENNNMSYLLNILDGIQENKGRIIIMTTNHIEKIDPAIIRPGRIDINLEFKPANNNIIKEILEYYWDEKVNIPEEINNIPHCQIIETCRICESLEDTINKLKNIKN